MTEESFLIVTQDRGVNVAELSSRAQLIEEPILEPLTKELLAAASASKPPVMLLDMSQTTFFGSGFLETLFRIWKTLQARPDANLSICGLHPYCREVLEITHLDKMWPLYGTREEALAAMQAK
ncbi:MAG: STAS domain-containing protein [Planctomycetaceae bacterium]|nr:STAS domain-containing protein [Planctomycetaceae bacterium]